MIIEGQGHFFIIYFPGFVCFVLYLAKISGERLQDHWSSGFCTCSKLFFMVRLICRAMTKSVFEPGLTQTRLCIYIHSKMVYVKV